MICKIDCFIRVTQSFAKFSCKNLHDYVHEIHFTSKLWDAVLFICAIMNNMALPEVSVPT